MRWMLLIGSMLTGVACLEGGDGRAPLDLPSPVIDAGTADASGDVSSLGPDGETPLPPRDAGPASVVFNEVSGKGEEWVELLNVGSSAIDLSGYRVADLDRASGMPKLDDATTLPPGTILSPNAYVLVYALEKDASAPRCPGAGESYCFGAKWGISNSNGEKLFLLNKEGTLVADVTYPANMVDTAQTWARLPNGTGTFQLGAATPGQRNQAAR